MRRKSTRNAGKKSSPEKGAAEKEQPSESPPTKTRRSRRRRRSLSKTSDSEDEVLTKTKRTPLEENTPDTTMQSGSPSDDEKIREERQWKVTPSVENVSQGEIQKLKICLKRPTPTPESPEKITTKTRRSKSGSFTTEDDNTNSSEDKSTRRTRLRGSPSAYSNNKTEDEDVDDKKGKGKSKGKHKSKIEKSSQSNETEITTNNEISENVQVTPQSPSIDIVVRKENEYKADADDTIIEQKADIDKNITNENEDKQCENKPVEDIESTEEQIKVVPQEFDNNSETDTQINQNNEKLDEIQSDVNEAKANIKENNNEETAVLENPKDPEEIVQTTEIVETVEMTEQVVTEKEEKSEEEKEEKSEEEKEEKSEKEKEEKPEEEKEEKSEEEKEEKREEKTIEISETKDDTSDRREEFDEEEPMDVDASGEFNLSGPATYYEEKKHEPEISNEKLEQKLEDNEQIETTKQSQEENPPMKRFLRRELFVSEEKEPKNNSEYKRKWQISVSSLISSMVKIDLETIQTFYPNIEFPQEPDLNHDLSREKRKSIDSKKILERKISVEIEKPVYETQSSTSSVNQESEDNSNIIAFNRKISIVDDTASKLKPPPSPAKNPSSEILFITNLVRPFTIKQLKELLERTGTIRENGFWTDKIKSKCYVYYETVEEAEATRNALHGVQWPIGNGKQLIIDYATPEDLENAMKPPVVVPVTPAEPEQKVVEKENKVVEKPKVDEKPTPKEEVKRKIDGPIREWDIGKKDFYREKSPSHERERGESDRRKHRNSSTPKDDYIKKKQRKLEENTPQKLMDDLFLKTKASPSIYWQPLSPEEIQMKQQQRLIRMEEHKRRIEENSRFRGRDHSGRGPPSFRRRYD